MKPCKSILLIEDDEDIRHQVKEVLNYEGYFVNTAKNGREALDYLTRIPDEELPGCLILDIMMPVMTGKELLDEIQAKHPERLGKIPVIVATAKGSPKEDLKDLPSRVVQIKKPMDIDDLMKLVHERCGEPSTE